jgi:hypothetical protein
MAALAGNSIDYPPLGFEKKSFAVQKTLRGVFKGDLNTDPEKRIGKM